MQILQSRLAISIPLLFFATLLTLGVLALNAPISALHPGFSKAVLVDMMLTGPLICLAMLAALRLPIMISVPIFVIGLNAAKFASPPDLRPFAKTVGWGSVAIIPGLLALTTLKILRKTWQAVPHVSDIVDPRDKVEQLASLVLGSDPKAKFLAADWAFVRYAIWPPKNLSANNTLQMTSHQTSGFAPLLWGLVGVIVLETLVLHIVVHLLSQMLAWILTITSLYSLLSLVGHIRALPRRRTTFDAETVTIRVGLFGQCRIPYTWIERVEQITATMPLPDEAIRLGILGAIEPSNLMLKLHSPVDALISHGFSRKASVLVFHIDNSRAFAAEVDRRNQREAHLETQS